jgi:hypothetical protein
MDELIIKLLDEKNMVTPDEKIMMIARSLHKAKVCQQKIFERRKERGIKLITTHELPKTEVKTRVATCTAINMNGKPCANKAVCGGLCRKHQIPDTIGKIF